VDEEIIYKLKLVWPLKNMCSKSLTVMFSSILIILSPSYYVCKF